MLISKYLVPIVRLIPLFFLSGCSSLFYYPTRALYHDPQKLNLNVEEIEFPSRDGTKLFAWRFPPKGGKIFRGTVVQFHGNAENRSSHFASLFWMVDEGYQLFTFDYRGYGESEGKPSQAGLHLDALAALEKVASLPLPSPEVRSSQSPLDKDLILYGQSLGGAVLVRALGDLSEHAPLRKRIRSVVIESSFHSYWAIGRDVLSRSWFTWIFQPLVPLLVSNAYGPEDYYKEISPIPILVIHGDQDKVIPHRFGEKIFELSKEPKKFWTATGAGHIAAMQMHGNGFREQFLKYLEAR